MVVANPNVPLTGTDKLTFLVCGKRHHFKFSPVNNADADRSGNLKAGAIVDTVRPPMPTSETCKG